MHGIEEIKSLNQYAATYQQIAKNVGIKTVSDHPAPVAVTPAPKAA